MNDLQKTINYLNLVLTKLSFDGYSYYGPNDSTFIKERVTEQQVLPSEVHIFDQVYPVLSKHRIKEEQILQLINTDQIPRPFKHRVRIADIGDKAVLLASDEELLPTKDKMKNYEELLPTKDKMKNYEEFESFNKRIITFDLAPNNKTTPSLITTYVSD